LWGGKGFLGFGKEVELAFAWDGNVSGERQPKRKAGQLVVRRLGERRCQNLLGGLLVVSLSPAKCSAASSVKV